MKPTGAGRLERTVRLCGDNMSKSEILDTLRDVGLALNVTHNTIATDIVGMEPNETSWRVDHSKELAKIYALEESINTGICPVCGLNNTCL